MLPAHWRRCRGCGLTQPLVLDGFCAACGVKKKKLPPSVARWLHGAVEKSLEPRHGNPEGWHLTRNGFWRKKDEGH
jgi:ribosomal protein L37E